MSQMIFVLSAAEFLLAPHLKLPLPTKTARSLVGLGVWLPGLLLVVRSARSWVELGSRNRKFHDQSQALSSRLRLSPLSSPSLRSLLTDRRRPVRGRRRGPRVAQPGVA